jgi:hypothetical protein
MEKQRKLKYRMASDLIAVRYRHQEPDPLWDGCPRAVFGVGAPLYAPVPVTPLRLAIMNTC